MPTSLTGLGGFLVSHVRWNQRLDGCALYFGGVFACLFSGMNAGSPGRDENKAY